MALHEPGDDIFLNRVSFTVVVQNILNNTFIEAVEFVATIRQKNALGEAKTKVGK